MSTLDLTLPANTSKISESAAYIRTNFSALLNEKFTMDEGAPNSTDALTNYIYYDKTGGGFYRYDGSSWTIFAKLAVNNLKDVDVTSSPLSDKNVLFWDSTNSEWVNASIEDKLNYETIITNLKSNNIKLTDLSNVQYTGEPTDGQILTYNSETDKWTNATGSSGGTDTKVTQTVSTDNSNYPILVKNTTGTTTVTDTAKFASAITVNPSTNTITASTFNGNSTGVSMANTKYTTETSCYPIWSNGEETDYNPKYNKGLIYKTQKGTTTYEGKSGIVLGNSTSKGTDDNITGFVQIYSDKANYVKLFAKNSDVENDYNTIYLPKSIDSTDHNITSTLVCHQTDTAVGSTTQPVYITADGVATATTYSLNKTVPSDAIFTDTTYTAGDNINIDSENDNKINVTVTNSSYNIKASVDLKEEPEESSEESTKTWLPLSDNTKNDLRCVIEDNKFYYWNIDETTGELANWVEINPFATVNTVNCFAIYA